MAWRPVGFHGHKNTRELACGAPAPTSKGSRDLGARGVPWAVLPQDTRWVQGRPWTVSTALPWWAGVPAAPNGLTTSPAPGPAPPARPTVGRTGVHRCARWTNASDGSTELPISGNSAWTGLQNNLPEEATTRDGFKYVVLPGPGQASPLSDGTPLQCSGLENPTRRGAWGSTAHGGHQESDMTGQPHSRFYLACGRKPDPRLSLSSASAQGGQGSPPRRGWKGSARRGALLQRSPGGDTHLDPPVSPSDAGRGPQLLHFICLRPLGESEKVSGRLPETIRQGARLTDPTVSGVLRPQASATIKPQAPSISSQAPFPSMPTVAQS